MTVPDSNMTFTTKRSFAVALILSFAMAVPVAARSQNAHSDTLIAVSAEVTLRVIEVGPAEAQSILLIPGWCFTGDIWSKQVEGLSDRYHIVTFDPRSQGRSTILDHSNSPDDRAGDIANLIKKLHLRKPIVIGWSQGVQDVAAYALRFGTGEVGGFVLVDAIVSAGAAGLDSKQAGMTLGRMPIYARSPRDYLQAMMPYVFKKRLSPAELETMVVAALRTPSSIGVANLTLDLFGRDYRQAFKGIDVPTLVVVAGTAQDKNEQMLQSIPNATSAVVDGAGHGVFYDEPTKFNELIVQFIEGRVKKGVN